MNPTSLRNLIQDQPEGGTVRSAVAQGDVEGAAELNRKYIPGFIPRRHLSAVLTTHRLVAVLDAAVDHQRVLNGLFPFTDSFFQLCSTLRWVLQAETDNLRTPIDEVLDQGCAALAPFTSLTAEQLKAELTSEPGLISLVEKEFGLDKQVTPAQVAAARPV